MERPARDLLRAGQGALASGDFVRAEDLLQRAESLARAESDCDVLVAATHARALVAERRGDPREAAARNATALVAARDCGDLEAAFFRRIAEARLRIDLNDLSAAAPLVDAARDESIAIGTLSARGEYLTLRARIRLAENALVESEELAREAVRAFDVQGASLERAVPHARARWVLAEVISRKGDRIEEIAQLRKVATLARDAGDRRFEAQAHERIADALLRDGFAEDARVWLENAYRDRLAGNDTPGAVAVLDRLDAIAQTAGREDRRLEYRARRERLIDG